MDTSLCLCVSVALQRHRGLEKRRPIPLRFVNLPLAACVCVCVLVWVWEGGGVGGGGAGRGCRTQEGPSPRAHTTPPQAAAPDQKVAQSQRRPAYLKLNPSCSAPNKPTFVLLP